MSTRVQVILLIILALISVVLAQAVMRGGDDGSQVSGRSGNRASLENPLSPNSAFERTSIPEPSHTTVRTPIRRWDVLDPSLQAEAVMVQSLDETFSFLNYRTYQAWPMASLTKLITAIVVLEDIGKHKRVVITEEAVTTEGKAGGLISGEEYRVEDLVKIMLMTSSNDAATAFEIHAGGREAFVEHMTQTIERLGMRQTAVYDASGLSEENITTASDLMKLVKYIALHTPDIFSWTRLQNFLVQPLNSTESRTIRNINPISTHADFLGGKTGTSDGALENLVALFSFNNYRLVTIILGSSDRVEESEMLLQWVEEAYEL